MHQTLVSFAIQLLVVRRKIVQKKIKNTEKLNQCTCAPKLKSIVTVHLLLILKFHPIAQYLWSFRKDCKTCQDGFLKMNDRHCSSFYLLRGLSP